MTHRFPTEHSFVQNGKLSLAVAYFVPRDEVPAKPERMVATEPLLQCVSKGDVFRLTAHEVALTAGGNEIVFRGLAANHAWSDVVLCHCVTRGGVS